MAHEFRFESKVAALLGQIALIREVRIICREEGPLANEIQRLVNHLRRELPALVPGMKAWQIGRPFVDSGRYHLQTAPGETWKIAASEIVFGLYMKCDPTFCALDQAESPLDQDPCVYIQIPLRWPNREKLILALKHSMPNGFTDSYPPGDVDEETPIWRYLRLEDYAEGRSFNVDDLIRQIAKSFQGLMSLCPIIDKFAPGKRSTAATK